MSSLKDKERKIIKMAAEGNGSFVFSYKVSIGNPRLTVNKQNLIINNNDHREFVEWQEAIENLLLNGLISNPLRGRYELTTEGYKLADKMSEYSVTPPSS